MQGWFAVVMTSDDLVRDLREVDWLIAALSAPYGADQEDLEDLRWLRARRRFLSALLAVRRAQKGKKIVNLELWRHGRAAIVSDRVAARQPRLTRSARPRWD